MLPLHDKKIGAEGEVDWSRTRNVSDDNPGAHKTANTGKQATVAHYYYGAPHDQKASHDTATRYGSIVENGY